MRFESSPWESNDSFVSPVIEVAEKFRDFIPAVFAKDPFLYFNEKGVNIKSGEPRYDEFGVIDEDPTAVKDFPVWTNPAGQRLEVVAKRVNTEKAQIKKKSDPFYEYTVMEVVRRLELPAPMPIVKVSQSSIHMIVMERVPGFRWVSKDIQSLKEKGYTHDDFERIEIEATEMMLSLAKVFSEAGINRDWKLRDMIFDLDVENKKVLSLTPVDWERTVLLV